MVFEIFKKIDYTKITLNEALSGGWGEVHDFYFFGFMWCGGDAY